MEHAPPYLQSPEAACLIKIRAELAEVADNIEHHGPTTKDADRINQLADELIYIANRLITPRPYPPAL